MTWQPIETAPTDGRHIILGRYIRKGVYSYEVVIAYDHCFDDGEWPMIRKTCHYTDWHDIAPPPK